jgi:hypothetical protein
LVEACVKIRINEQSILVTLDVVEPQAALSGGYDQSPVFVDGVSDFQSLPSEHVNGLSLRENPAPVTVSTNRSGHRALKDFPDFIGQLLHAKWLLQERQPVRRRSALLQSAGDILLSIYQIREQT